VINAIVAVFIVIGILFSILRLLKGPSTADRVVGIDTANIIVTGLIVFIAHIYDNNLYLDIALAYGVLSFLETVIISKYLEGRV